MKKGFLAILTALTVLALVMIGCPGTDPDPDDPGGATTHTVTFDLNGGTGTVAAQTVEEGKDVTLPSGDGLTGPAGKPIFIGWNTTAAGTSGLPGTTYGPITQDITLYAIWSVPVVEKVTLSNSAQVVYMFNLPAGKKWSDYDKITASYMLEEDADFEVEGSARTIRLYGNYNIDFFQFNTTTAGNKYAYASIDGNENNNAYILDDLGLSGVAGYSNKLSNALTTLLGECPPGGTYFTLEYKIDGSRANEPTYKHLPEDTETGPFIFGLGIPGQNDINTIYVKDVFLVDKTSTETAPVVVRGLPLFISKKVEGVDDAVYDYPVFTAYGTATGNGVDNIGREAVEGIYPAAVAAVEAPVNKITFDLNTTGAAWDSTDTNNPIVSGKVVKEVGKYKRATPFPKPTKAGNKLDGWGLTASAVAADAIPERQLFAADTTVYAIWRQLPNATADFDVKGAAGFKVSSFGGLGELNDDAGFGPFNYVTTASDACIWFAYPAVIDTEIYSKLEIVLNLTKKTSGVDQTKPMKLTVHNGRAKNVWSGGTPSYPQANTDGPLTIELEPASVGVAIQLNSYGGTAAAPETADFELTITSIKLIKP